MLKSANPFQSLLTQLGLAKEEPHSSLLPYIVSPLVGAGAGAGLVLGATPLVRARLASSVVDKVLPKYLETGRLARLAEGPGLLGSIVKDLEAFQSQGLTGDLSRQLTLVISQLGKRRNPGRAEAKLLSELKKLKDFVQQFQEAHGWVPKTVEELKNIGSKFNFEALKNLPKTPAELSAFFRNLTGKSLEDIARSFLKESAYRKARRELIKRAILRRLVLKQALLKRAADDDKSSLLKVGPALLGLLAGTAALGIPKALKLKQLLPKLENYLDAELRGLEYTLNRPMSAAQTILRRALFNPAHRQSIEEFLKNAPVAEKAINWSALGKIPSQYVLDLLARKQQLYEDALRLYREILPGGEEKIMKFLLNIKA